MSVFTTGKLGHPSRILAAIVLCGTFAFIIPSSSVADTTDSDDKTRKRMETNEEDGVDWQAIRTTDPDEWSDELRAQLVSAGYDVDRIAARVRAGQADAVKREAMTTPQEEWSEDLIQKLLDLMPGYTIDKIARVFAAKATWKEAIRTNPDDWSEDLKARLLEVQSDSTIEEIAERIRRQQKRMQQKDGIGENDVWRRIKAAIQAGEITPEEGRRRYAAYMESQKSEKPDLEAIGQRIRTAIANGDLTPEQGRKKYEAARRKMQGELKKNPDVDVIARRLRTAVQNGDITEEEARQRYARILEEKKSNAPDLVAIGRRLKTAVENGDLTPEEARRRYAEYLERHKAKSPELEAVGSRLREAVESGILTAEEARRRYAAYLENQRDATTGDSDRLAKFRQQVIDEAMAAPPSDWSDELKAKITRLGWDLDAFAEGILARQNLIGESTSESRGELRGTRDPTTSQSRPRAYSLRSRGPNPFNPQTSLQYDLPKPGVVRIVIYSLTGQVVRTLVNQQMPAGSYQLVWDGTSDAGREVSSGVYLIDMQAGTFSDILKVTLAK